MLIDANCSLGRWPFQVHRDVSPAALARELGAAGVGRAYVWAMQNVLAPDPDEFNRRLVRRTKGAPSLVPVMVHNPSLTHWPERLARYAAEGLGRTARIVPSYHGYRLTDPCAADFAGAFAQSGGKALFLQMRVDDERSQYPLMRVDGPPAEEVVAFANRVRPLPVVCCCAYWREAERMLQEADNLYADISFFERMNTLRAMLGVLPAERMLFGTHAPMLYTLCNVMKIRHAEIPEEALRAIGSGNAEHMLG